VLGSLGRKAKLVVDFFKVIDEVIMKMVNAIMWMLESAVLFVQKSSE
jgi:Na+/H+-dicarboxylate symporter